MSNGDGTYTMSPEKSEQGVVWFSHDLNPETLPYAERGAYKLTIPLSVETYKDVITYEDGSTEEVPSNLGEDTENSRGWGKYLLPEGFLFSYKSQKFIISENDITFSNNQVESTADPEIEKESEHVNFYYGKDQEGR